MRLAQRFVAPAATVAILVSVIASMVVIVPAAAASAPSITWQGTIGVSGGGGDPENRWNSSWTFDDLVPLRYDNYGVRAGSSGSHTRVEYCRWTGEDAPASYDWAFSSTSPNTDEDFPDLSLTTDDQGRTSLVVYSRGAPTTKSHACTADGSPTTEELILADAFGLNSFGLATELDFGVLPDVDPDPLRLLGSVDGEWAGSGATFEYTASYDLVGSVSSGCGSFPGDDDGDRLPNAYESGHVGSDPNECDTDGDTYWDAIEVASGSSPTSAAHTPDTLSSGVAPRQLVARGDAGVTCGRNKFKWVSPALKSLGGAKGRRGCIFLLSNDTTNGIIDLALSHNRENITQVLSEFVQPHLLEIYGEEALNWSREAESDAEAWSGRRLAKEAMLRALNLTRRSAIFTVARLAGLAGVPYAAFWSLNQVRNKNACMQVRVGTTSTGSTRLSWSLVYSSENLTSEGLNDGLHEAAVWKKKVVNNGADRAVRKSINLSCRQGQVRAFGGSAAKVFDAATSFVF